MDSGLSHQVARAHRFWNNETAARPCAHRRSREPSEVRTWCHPIQPRRTVRVALLMLVQNELRLGENRALARSGARRSNPAAGRVGSILGGLLILQGSDILTIEANAMCLTDWRYGSYELVQCDRKLTGCE